MNLTMVHIGPIQPKTQIEIHRSSKQMVYRTKSVAGYKIYIQVVLENLFETFFDTVNIKRNIRTNNL